MRTKEALALREAEGMVLGRKKGTYIKFNILIANRRAVIQMLRQGKPITEVCKHYTLSCGTFDKFRRSYPSVHQSVLEKKDIIAVDLNAIDSKYPLNHKSRDLNHGFYG